jgi:hypothetical protein
MNVSVPRFLGAAAIIAVTLPTSAGANAPAGQYVVTAGGTPNGTVYDTKSKLTWQQTVSSMTYTWAAAQTYCAGLDTSLGGTGWRLPTAKELISIVDLSQASAPMIDPNAFPSTPSAGFWSSSPAGGSPPSTAWLINFNRGSWGYDYVSYTYYVRCVR